jgi:hypothetical protein
MKSMPAIVAVLALGVITCNAEDPAKPAPPPGTPPQADGERKRGGRDGERPRMKPEDVFKKLDADNSGDISLAEFKAGPRAQKHPEKAEEFYKKIDANSDGKVTLEEFKAGRPDHGPGGRPDKGPRPGGPRPDAPKAE